MMAAVNLQGGKTAPRLLQDLLIYDPQKPSQSGFNVLIDIPIFSEEDGAYLPPPPRIGRGSCRHQWSLKPNQCVLPQKGYPADQRTVWILACYCALCRSHLDLKLDFREGGSCMKPCPFAEQPLHHFVYKPELSSPANSSENSDAIADGFAWNDVHRFECSAWECHADLTLRVKPPRLSQEWVDLLNDRFIIKARAEQAIASDPERFEGFAVPPPVDVLLHSKHYITNPLFNPEKSKKIQGHNKRFLLSMGEPCADLLQYFGFAREGEDWLPPQVEPAANLPFRDNIRLRIDDVEKELFVLISQAAEEDRRKAKHVWAPESAINDLKFVLGCSEYQKTLRSRTVDLTKNTQEHPYYAGLGAVEDFHDELLIFAYEQQIASDMHNTPYYLECLQGIAEGRNSEQLQIKISIEASSGKISRRDVRAAYRELGLDIKDAHEDETIIGVFNSRIADAPKQEPQMRRALNVIGQHRSSERIQVVASQEVTNYEQALSFLGVTHSTTDDFIASIFNLRINDRPADEGTARRAVVFIAHHRSSQALKDFLNTGILGEVEMDVDAAYARLDISERNVDDELVLIIYNSRVSDDPSQIDTLRQALDAISKSRNSRRISEFLDSGMISSDHSLSEWPVGLENIGNTCYLNSLLQFYFTIKPLRDLLLKIDNHKTPTDEATLKSKRVGSRNVSAKEVARAQNFVDELRKLFENMIASSKASVTPEPELARLTLLSSDKAEYIRRQSILSPTRPSLGEIGGQPILGPLGPPPAEAIGDTEMTGVEQPSNQHDAIVDGDSGRETDNSSDVTLVDRPMTDKATVAPINDKEQSAQRKIFENKENLPPTKEPIRVSSSDFEFIPLEEASPSRLNEQRDPPNPPIEDEEDMMEMTEKTQESPITNRTLLGEGVGSSAAPPKRSPPLPPRPKPAPVATSNALQEAELGAQQDVTEVIANFLFQLQCAIRADSIDGTGEQIDQVKKLFFGKQKSYTTDKQGNTRTKEEYMSDIKVDVATGPRDIYAALDGAYDVQDVEVGRGVEPQYTSISVLPPVLQVHVQRSLYDREKKAAFKSTNHLKLRERIFMDRYMDSDDPDLLERRRQCWQWKREILSLEERRDQITKSETGMDMPAALGLLRDYLNQLQSSEDNDSIGVTPELVQNVRKAASEAKNELRIIETKIRDLGASIAGQFNDLQRMPYRLQSVFVHRGYHNSGHYWIYIHDFRKNMWRKYNDGYVTEVADTSEIFVQEAGDRPATPYFLVYVKDEKMDDLVDSVCRRPVEPPLQEQDTMMEDYVPISELPANEQKPYQPTNALQEYGVTDSYQSELWNENNANWDDSSRRAPLAGW